MFQQTLAHLNLEISTPDLWRKEFPCHGIRRHPAAEINARCLHDVTRPSLMKCTQSQLIVEIEVVRPQPGI